MSADSHYLQGCIEHATGDFPASLKSLTAALSVDEALRNSPAFSYSYGVLLAIAGLHEAAVDAFTAAVEQSSLAGGTEAEAGVARVAVGGGGGGGALGCPAVYHHERAKSYQQLGRYAEALADYNCVLPKSLVSVLPASASDASRSQVTEPVNWNALVNRALTLKELQWYDAAAADWDAALRMDRSGCLAQFTSQDIFEMSYMELCLPGCELYEFNTM
jgi:tetratricopeptide (TPR) repeat protein